MSIKEQTARADRENKATNNTEVFLPLVEHNVDLIDPHCKSNECKSYVLISKGGNHIAIYKCRTHVYMQMM